MLRYRFFHFFEVNSRVAVLFDGTYRIMSDAINKQNFSIQCVSAGCSMPNGLKHLYGKKWQVKLPDDAHFMTWDTFFNRTINVAPVSAQRY